MNATLTRAKSTDKGTFGILSLDGLPLCVTCEDPWNDNKQNISCIPAGTYTCKPFNGLKFHDVWEVTNVQGRGAILIHTGNTINDTHGCILVGRAFSTLGNLPSVMQSQEAMAILKTKLPETFELTIYGA